jgi:hypothetical protein
VPIAALPGLQSAPVTASLFPPWSKAPAASPRPPVEVGAQPAASGSMDNWLLDRLFGRR